MAWSAETDFLMYISVNSTKCQLHAQNHDCIWGHLVERNCYDSNISPTYRRHPVRLRMSNSVRWMRHFALSDTSCPTRPSVLMFSFLLQLKYFSDLLQMSGWTPDVRLCAMAVAFFHYRTTCAQFGQVFRCFSFHNISPFLLPDLFS